MVKQTVSIFHRSGGSRILAKLKSRNSQKGKINQVGVATSIQAHSQADVEVTKLYINLRNISSGAHNQTPTDWDSDPRMVPKILKGINKPNTGTNNAFERGLIREISIWKEFDLVHFFY